MLQDLVDDDSGNMTCRAGCTGGHDGVDKRKGDFMIWNYHSMAAQEKEKAYLAQ
jgi:hypothetical protein